MMSSHVTFDSFAVQGFLLKPLTNDDIGNGSDGAKLLIARLIFLSAQIIAEMCKVTPSTSWPSCADSVRFA